jgi:putative transposase
VNDYIHCFVGLKPIVAVSDLMQTVKAKLSKYINNNKLTKKNGLNGRMDMVYFHTGNRQWTMYISKYKTRGTPKKQPLKNEYLAYIIKFTVDYDEQHIFKS